MKKLLFVVLLLSAQMLFAQALMITERNATVSFLFLDDDVDGTLSDFKFTGKINLSDLENSTISGTVASETIDTNNWFRNRHLRNKYFKTDDFPKLSFKSTSIKGSDKNFIVKGTLTIKGISKPVSFSFTNSEKQLTGKASINASDFDIYIHDEATRNKLSIKITMPFTSE